MAMGYGTYCQDWDADGNTWCFVEKEKCSFKDVETHYSAFRSTSTCTAKDSDVKIFVEYPGIGIGAITGTIDYKNYVVEFDDEADHPNCAQQYCSPDSDMYSLAMKYCS